MLIRFGSREELSAAVAGERRRLKERLKRPTAGQMDAYTASGLPNPGSEFEQLTAQGLDLCGA